MNRAQTDAQGNVYVLGQVFPATRIEDVTHFDADMVLPFAPFDQNIHKESLFLIKYDSNGNFQWLRMPQPSDVTLTNSITYTNATDLQVDAQGNTFSLCYLPIGIYAAGAYAVSAAGFSILKYDTNGVFLGGVPLDIQLQNPRDLLRMRRNHNTGDIYVSAVVPHQIGSETVTVHGELIANAMFIAAFNSNGSFLWKRENANKDAYPSANNLNSIAIDAQNNVYFAAGTGPIFLEDSTTIADSFNGTTIATNTTATPIPFIVKMDASGNTIWLTHGNRTAPLDLIINGDEVAISGGGRNTQWQTVNFVDPVSGNHPYIARFNKTNGAIIAINALPSSGGDYGTALATDSKGNYYMGGRFGSLMTVGAGTLTNSGGTHDFFIAKFGTDDCDFLATTQPQQQTIEVYPNPVNAMLHIANASQSHYVLYDVLGNKVGSGAVMPQGSIDMTRLASGVYMLQLQDEAGATQMKKVIKE